MPRRVGAGHVNRENWVGWSRFEGMSQDEIRESVRGMTLRQRRFYAEKIESRPDVKRLLDLDADLRRTFPDLQARLTGDLEADKGVHFEIIDEVLHDTVRDPEHPHRDHCRWGLDGTANSTVFKYGDWRRFPETAAQSGKRGGSLPPYRCLSKTVSSSNPLPSHHVPAVPRPLPSHHVPAVPHNRSG